MTDTDRVEILAMNIHFGVFGLTALRADFIEWAKAHPVEVQALYSQAEAMIGLAKSPPGASTPRTTHHHSLGWLFS